MESERHGPKDPRGHQSLADDSNLEYITQIEPEVVSLINPLMQEADEFFDEDLHGFCNRFLRLKTAIGGGRAKLMAQVAMKDEALIETPEGRVQRPRV